MKSWYCYKYALLKVKIQEAFRFSKPLFLTIMTPVSLLASMMEMRQVLGRTAAMISSTSTRAVSLDTGTYVTSVAKTYMFTEIKINAQTSQERETV